MNILLVEDDALVASAIAEAFAGRPDVSLAHEATLRSALDHVVSADAVLLDLNLEDSRGAETLRRVRECAAHVPVIIISAIDRADTRIETLYGGADDYLTKPFSLEELLARVEAVTRRTRQSQPLSLMALVWERRSRRITWQGENLNLTPLEYEIFQVLASTPGAAFSRQDILARVVGPNFYGYERVVDVHVGHLRKKLAVLEEEAIETVRAFGYRWRKECPVEVSDD